MPDRLALPPDVVEVWWAAVDVDADVLAALAADIDPAGQARISRLRQAADVRRATVAHGLVRRLSAAHLGVAPRQVTLRRECVTCGATDHGKPTVVVADAAAFVATAVPEVNLSHSGELVVVALTAMGTPTGVDVEQIQPGLDWTALRAHTFGDDEWALTGSEADPVTARFRAWARKEAVSKAAGHGLAVELAAVRMQPPRLSDGWRRACTPLTAGSVLVADLDLQDDHAAAVAIVDPPGGTESPPQLNVTRADLRHRP